MSFSPICGSALSASHTLVAERQTALPLRDGLAVLPMATPRLLAPSIVLPTTSGEPPPMTMPICTPELVDIARYFFVNAMTTISAVVFLYSPETKVASIAILNLDEAGEMGAAAACAVMIAAASTVATLLFWLLARYVERRTQAWKA